MTFYYLHILHTAFVLWFYCNWMEVRFLALFRMYCNCKDNWDNLQVLPTNANPKTREQFWNPKTREQFWLLRPKDTRAVLHLRAEQWQYCSDFLIYIQLQPPIFLPSISVALLSSVVQLPPFVRNTSISIQNMSANYKYTLSLVCAHKVCSSTLIT